MKLVNSKLLTHQAAEVLGVTPDAVRAMDRRKLLHAERVGHIRLFDAAEVEKLAVQRQRKAITTAIVQDSSGGNKTSVP